jgi:small-conductance mechanosensitive channel
MNVPGFDLSQVAVNDVAHAMQLALGPVFLLNGVGVMLAMLTTRLARIVDRARTVEERLPQAQGSEQAEIRRVLAVTRRRARLMNRAITLGTVAALLVALIVALLFLAAFLTFPIGHTIALLFVICMGTLIGSLWCFLVEVRVATAALRIGTYKLREEEQS